MALRRRAQRVGAHCGSECSGIARRRHCYSRTARAHCQPAARREPTTRCPFVRIVGAVDGIGVEERAK